MDQKFQQNPWSGLFLLCDVWGLGWGVSEPGLTQLCWWPYLWLGQAEEVTSVRGSSPMETQWCQGDLCSGQKLHSLLGMSPPWGHTESLHYSPPVAQITGSLGFRGGVIDSPRVEMGSKNLHPCFKTTNLSRQQLFISLSQAKYTHFILPCPPAASFHYGFGHTLRAEDPIPSSSLDLSENPPVRLLLFWRLPRKGDKVSRCFAWHTEGGGQNHGREHAHTSRTAGRYTVTGPREPPC